MDNIQHLRYGFYGVYALIIAYSLLIAQRVILGVIAIALLHIALIGMGIERQLQAHNQNIQTLTEKSLDRAGAEEVEDTQE